MRKGKTCGFLPMVSALLCLLGLVTVGRAQEPKEDRAAPVPQAPQAPILGAYLGIWFGDPVDNTRPSVAYSRHHDEYLVAWQNERLAETDIYARRVGADGTLLSWFTIIAATNRWNQDPAVAYTPVQDCYLVVYTYNGPPPDTTTDIRGRFLSWDGSYFFPELIIRQEAGSQLAPAVAYNSRDDEFLVVYENWWPGGLRDIAAQRIKASTLDLLSWRNIATGAGQWRFAPSVAYNEELNEYLITYTHSPGATYGDGDILGRVVSANMGTLSAEIPIVGDSFDQQNSDVAAARGEYLVVWEDGTYGTNNYDIYARRVSGDGTPQGNGGGFEVDATTTNRRENPTVAFGNGFGYLIAWSYAEGLWPPTVLDVYGAMARPYQDGTIGPAFPLDAYEGYQLRPDVACGDWNGCLMVEQDNFPLTSGFGYEIRGRRAWIPYVRSLLPVTLRNEN